MQPATHVASYPLQQSANSNSQPPRLRLASRQGGRLRSQLISSNNLPQNERWHLPRILLSNARSLRYKIDELSVILEHNNIDIGCVTESWLGNDVPDEAVTIGGYKCYRHDRSDGRKGGGVACYVGTSFPCTRLYSLETADLESIWLLVRRPRMPRPVSHIAIGVIYHPPGAPSWSMSQHITNAMDTIISQHPYAGIVILGDFNTMDARSIRSYPLKQVVG